MNKKVYQQPETLKVAVVSKCIICASLGDGGIPVNGEGQIVGD